MKELSIEEKAKRYDEAIKLAKDSFNYPSYPGFIRADVVFPELKKSEDERIREELLNAFQNSEDSIYIVLTPHKRESFIAWLKKQGEHANFRNKIQIGDKVTRNKDGVLVNLSQLKRVAKPAEEYNITGIGSKHATGKLSEKIKELKPLNEILEKQCEQKPAWSEEDEKMIRALVSMCDVWATSHQFYTKENKEMEAVKTWLKSLKNRVQPQPKQEWSEEDENNILFLTSIIEECFKDKKKITLCGDTVCANFTKEDVINRLKSLRPQPHWKPSDEQMNALREAVIEMGKSVSRCSIEEFHEIESLYNDLKKLKG